MELWTFEDRELARAPLADAEAQLVREHLALEGVPNVFAEMVKVARHDRMGPGGLEPPTIPLERGCAIQLRHGLKKRRDAPEGSRRAVVWGQHLKKH